jgi:pyridoxine/pyridoxamine 5'-phosphate oxidase
VFFTQERSRKARNVARDPRVALSVVDESNPYRNAQIRGRVVEVVEGEDALEIIDRISQRYIGEPFPMRSGNVYRIEPETAHFTELPFRH